MSGAATDIALVGMAARFPGARSVDEFWRNLRDGVESIRRYSEEELRAAGVAAELLANPHYVRAGAPLEEMERFDAAFFGFSPREAAVLDPQHRHFLEVAWEALEHAGHPPRGFPGPVGLFAGSGHNAYLAANLLTNPELVRSVGLFLLRHTGNDKDFLTTRVSYLLDLRGPSLNVQTACSTSLVAVHLAVQSLLTGECDLALAGGVTIELPHRHGYLYEEGEILAPDGHCRAFDASSAGTVFGSGVGIVVLRRLADAIADGDTVYAVVKGSAINNDGADKVGYLAPSVGGQSRAVAEALAVSGIDPGTISYVEAHGTGTPVGDPIEIAALTQAFRQGTDRVGYCGIGSVKTNIGHLDTAAGVASLIKVVLAMRHGEIPPSLNFSTPNPALDLEKSPFRVVAKRTDWAPGATPRRALVNSLGVGGTNAHVIVEEAPALEPSEPGGPWHLLPLSARTPDALDAQATRLADHLAAHPEEPLGDVAWTLQVGRTAQPVRRFVVAATHAEAASALEQPERTASKSVARRGVALMFAGGGAQYPGMGRDLYASEPVYRESVEACLALLDPALAPDVRQLLLEASPSDACAAARLERPSLCLPALFITQYANAQLWKAWGLEPTAMIGHSVGEYSAALLAGVFELRDALALVTLRGRIFERVPPGAMLGVALSAADLAPLLGPTLSIAASNAPDLSVASGPIPDIDALERELASRDVDCVRVRISVAAHSAMLEPFLAEFGAFLRRVSLAPPSVPFVSNVTGDWITADEATSPDYWVRQLRQTVRFADGLGRLLEDPSRVCLEVGPGRTLVTLARLHPDRKPAHLLATSLRHPDESEHDQATMLGAVGRLWQAGVAIDWKAITRGARRRIGLPTYPFEGDRHWIEPGRVAAPESAAAPAREHGRSKDVADWFWEPEWVRTPLQPDGAIAGVVLVLAHPGPLTERLIETLITRGAEVVVAAPGDALAEVSPGRWTLSPADAEHYEALLRALADAGRTPVAILHGLTLTTLPAAGDAALERAVLSAMALGRALAVLELECPIRVIAAGSGLFDLAGEGVDDLVKATLLGPIRVMPREIPGVESRAVDVRLPPAGTPAEVSVAAQLADEIATSGEDAVAWRGTKRWTERRVPRPRSGDGPSRLGSKGRYLITGGTGGIGSALARDLAARFQARLALVGRTALPPRDQWTDLVRTAARTDATAERVRAVLALEACGAEVLLLTADVSDAAAMSSAYETARVRFCGIDGVFHAAGTMDDALMAFKDPGAARRVLAPKVAGGLALRSALVAAPPGFAVLFSSVSSFAGVAGQADYAAANAFLDGLAHDLTRRAGIPAVAIAWGPWRDVGMLAVQSGQVAHELPTQSGEALDPPYPFLDRWRRDEEVYVCSASLSPARHWLLGEHRVSGGDALIPGAGYLELVRAALARAWGPGAIELADVAFMKPFAVPDGEERQIEIRILGASGARCEFVVCGLGAQDDDWVEHVRGAARRLDGVPARATADATAISARCRTRWTPAPGERLSSHLDFGPRWHSIREIAYGDGEAVVSLELAAVFADDLRATPLHPALLDMATAGAQRLIPGFDPDADFLVPLSYGKAAIMSPLAPALRSVVTLKPGSGRDSAAFDVAIVDEDGRRLVDIEDFTMIRVGQRSQLAAHPNVEPASRRAAPAAGLLHDAIRPAEGALALDWILRGALPEGVIVSPLPLTELLSAVRTPPQADPEPKQGSGVTASSRNLTAVADALRTHEAVADAVVAERRDQTGAKRIVAWVAFRPGEQATVSELRRLLRASVPEDQVADAYVEVDAIARVGGEPDWSTLVSPFGSVESSIAPRTPTEHAIADLWCELLGAASVSVRDNFFDIGGHSLLSVRFLNRLQRKIGVRLLHEQVVVHTLEQLAGLAESRAAARV